MSISAGPGTYLSTGAAEDKTQGEIIRVLQSSATATRVAAAVADPAVAPVAFTAMPVYRILALQLIAFVAMLLLVGIPRVQLCSCRAGPVTDGLSRRHGAVRHPPDREQKDRCGILIFVSLAERYARIIADDGIAQVPQSAWQAAVDALIACARGQNRRRIHGDIVCAAPAGKHSATAPKSEELSTGFT